MWFRLENSIINLNKYDAYSTESDDEGSRLYGWYNYEGENDTLYVQEEGMPSANEVLDRIWATIASYHERSRAFLGTEISEQNSGCGCCGSEIEIEDEENDMW